MPKIKKNEEKIENAHEVKEVAKEEVKVLSELEQLQALYKEMQDRGINSIGDLEVKISRLQ